MPHAPLMNLIAWHRGDPRLSRAARTLQFASIGFDVSFQEMFSTWCCGGTLYMISESTRRDPHLLWQVIVNSQIERMFMPYVALQQLALSADSEISALRDIISAGEVLQLTPEIRRLCRSGNDCRLHNHYGPTECHVATSYVLSDNHENWPAVAPIGRPIPNARIHILHGRQQLAPIGVAGELCIGGAPVGRGYLNRPELTAEKFVASPFSKSSGDRLYRTGDCARWRHDGNIEFFGRLDNQVKLRGHRVELGEVEAILSEHDTVAQCAAAVCDDDRGQQRLVAYCVAAKRTSLDFDELSAYLRSRLPEHMVPSAFIELPELPLTANGKLDRASLPPPGESPRLLAAAAAAPTNPTEQRLVEIWRETLKVNVVGVDDNFFNLGGNSLMAVRLFDRIEQTFGRKLPLALLYQHGTIRSIAGRLAGPCARPTLSPSFRFNRTATADRCLSCRQSAANSSMRNRSLKRWAEAAPSTGFSRTSPRISLIGLQALNLRPPAMPKHCAFRPGGPYALSGYSYGGLLAYETARQLVRLGEKVDLLAILDSGPGSRGKSRQRGDRRRWVIDATLNMPFWLREEWPDFSTARLLGSAARKLKRLRRLVLHRLNANNGPSPQQIDEVFDFAQIPSHSRLLMQQVFNAYRAYIPSPYPGKVTLFRASARALLGSFAGDAGWRRFAHEVEIIKVAGNHDSILHLPRVRPIAAKLCQLLNQLEAAN